MALTEKNLHNLNSMGPPALIPAVKEQKGASRRAAYNALVRLKENSSRLKMLPEALREKLCEENGTSKVPSDLITMLVGSGNDLNLLSSTFRSQQEQVNELHDKQCLEPMTEQQIINLYGADEAKSVISAKKASGLTVPDRNNPGRETYLMFQGKKELNLINRNSA